MKRLLQLSFLVLLLSGSIAVLAYVGLPYMPLRLTALRLNSYLYGQAEVLEADFEGQPTIGVRPLAVSFSNTSLGEYTESKWDFGDGQTSALEDPLHLYFATGSYTVTLTITGTLGTDTITKTNYVEVYDPLRADFSADPTSGIVPFTADFTNLSAGEYTACQWDFGDGQGSASCLDQAHEYTVAGAYTVTLTVSSTFDIDTATKVAYIRAFDELEADFEADPQTGVRPLLVSFTNLSRGSVDDCSWDFGDGSTSDRCDPLHTYSMKGIYSVALTVSGPAGQDTLTRSDYIRVYEPIVANFKGDPVSGIRPLQVAFSNTSSGDFETCTWDFGDEVINNSCADVVHTYTSSGSFTVTLTASNPVDSDTRAKEAYIVVYEPVKADFRASPLHGERPLKVTFSNTSSGDYSTCLWDFGDGKSSGKCDTTHTYTYKRSGYYTVTLTVSGLGGTDTLIRPRYINVELGHLYLPITAYQGKLPGAPNWPEPGNAPGKGQEHGPSSEVRRIGGR